MPDPNGTPVANIANGEYGFEDVINSASPTGTPDGALEPQGGNGFSPEDTDENKSLDIWGAADVGNGMRIATVGNPYKTVDCLNGGRQNVVTGARHVLRLVDGSLGNVPVRPDTGLGGFTVASENPVYVFGDYNSNAGDPFWANPGGAADINHAAAAVLADAVTLQSNPPTVANPAVGWSDLNSMVNALTLTNRNASATYYRLAIAGGKNMNFPQPAGTGADFGTDGGVHNFLRLVEDWGGVDAELSWLSGQLVLFRVRYRHFQVLHHDLQRAQPQLLLRHGVPGSGKAAAGHAHVAGRRQPDVLAGLQTVLRETNDAGLLKRGRLFWGDGNLAGLCPAGQVRTPAPAWFVVGSAGSFLGGLTGGGAFVEGQRHDPQHVVPGRGLAGPDLELARRLVDEHLDARDHFRAALFRHLHQPRFRGIVNHVEHITRVDLIFVQWRLARVAHAHRSGVDDDIESELFQVGAFGGPRPGLAGQLLRRAGGAIQDVNFGSALLEPEDGGARGAARAQDQDLRLLQRDALFQRTHHAGGVGVESVKLSVLRPHHGVAGADFGGVGIGVVEMLEDGFLVRHGDGEAVNRNIAHAAQQVFQRLGMQREVDAVHIFAAQRRIHDGGRKRMRDRIAGHAVHSGGRVHLLDAIGAAQLLRRDLAGRGFLVGTDRGEGEDAARAHSQQTG